MVKVNGKKYDLVREDGKFIFTTDEMLARQRKAVLEKHIAKETGWTIETRKANIWEGQGSIQCTNCGDNLNAQFHIDMWEMGMYYNWERYDERQKQSALVRFPLGISCFQCGCVLLMYRNDNAVREDRGEGQAYWYYDEEE